MWTRLFLSLCPWGETEAQRGSGCPGQGHTAGKWRGKLNPVGRTCSDELDPNPRPSRSSQAQGLPVSVLPRLHLSDEVPADLRLLVEEGQDVVQQVADQRGLVVHGGVEESQGGPAHIQVWVLQALHELSWQKDQRWCEGQHSQTQTTPPRRAHLVNGSRADLAGWGQTCSEHLLCTTNLQSPDKNVDLSLAWVQIQA